MGVYNRNDRGGDRGGRRFGGRDSGRRSFGGRDSGRREMHHATCAQCGKDCEVPFMPSGDRPVYCSNCFESRRNEDGNSRGSNGRNFGRPNFEERRSYSGGGGDRGDTRGNDYGQLTEQLKNLNAKLDKILRLLEPKITQPPVPKKEVLVYDVEPKEEKSQTLNNEADIVLQPKIAKTKTPKKKVKQEKVETEETALN